MGQCHSVLLTLSLPGRGVSEPEPFIGHVSCMSNLKSVVAAFAGATSAKDYSVAKRAMGRLSIPEQHEVVDSAIACVRRLREVGVL
jgi:hypothetical protein